MESDLPVDRIAQMLAAHPFTRDLPGDEVRSLADLASLREFASGEVIFRADAPADAFYLVRSGLVALEVDAGGSAPRVIQHIAEGSALGWSWLFPPYLWHFTAVARSPVRTIAFEAAALRTYFEAEPQCGYHVLFRVAGTMADRLHATRHQVVSLVS